MTDLSARTGARLVASDRVEGTSVYNHQGEKLGHIERVFIDKVSGQAEFAQMAFGGVMGVGHKHHPLPWSVLTYDTDKNGFVVNLDKKALSESPAYDEEHLRGEDTAWVREVTGHFGGS